jgi:hypothetical protein
MNRKNEYRDLEKWRNTKRKSKLKNYRKTQNAENHGKRWDGKDIQKVLAHEISDAELSQKLGRSVQAIQMCRLKHKQRE